ncbi:MAG: NUDIX hydrolase [Anaerolineaceae bacterium]|jgi:8-oxo-dGTP pyrophosphatase MutT (NUDIX family)
MKHKIRPLAIGIFSHTSRILLHEGYDRIKQQTFYRPLGGGIEFGETGAEALAREMHEEIGQAIRDIRYLGTLENIFTFEGEPGHEIVLVYDAAFVDSAIYQKTKIDGIEGEDIPFVAVWKALEDFSNSRGPLYPDGLYNLLMKE